MLIRFSVENYMSFKEQQIFSMAAGKSSRHPSHIVSIGTNRLLKSSFIFGANAAGKSNFIHAVDFMRQLVTTGDSKSGRSRDRYFRIDPSYSKLQIIDSILMDFLLTILRENFRQSGSMTLLMTRKSASLKEI